MSKKTLWFASFFILIVLNFFIVFNYINKVRKVNAAVRILDEIGTSAQTESFESIGMQADIQTSDGRAANLKNFFRKYNSPLYDQAEHIVKISDKYQFDYRLLPAIAMQESTLCQQIPPNSHNCWGWGIYGTTVTSFPSYEEAIETVAKGIREEYINKGFTKASEIMRKYTPSSQGSWAAAVNKFMISLE